MESEFYLTAEFEPRIPYNLQFFAKEGAGGEKTEPATEKKLRDARDKGQVAKSKEVANGFSLLAIFLLLKLWAGRLGIGMGETFMAIYNRIPEVVKQPGGTPPQTDLLFMTRYTILRILIITAPVFAVGFLIAFVSNVIQVGWHPTLKTMEPKFDKLNPISGFKRFFSLNALAELIKSIAKIGLVGYVSWGFLKKNNEFFFSLLNIPLMAAVEGIGMVVIDLGIRISLVYMVIVIADFVFQKWKFAEDMKMTKQEVKDEMKDVEGNPQIKQKQRQRMQEASRRRMMQQLPDADVVITNPTHYAVAVKYDPDRFEAPVVLAKGADYLALKIKETAREHHIEIVENKPLARMLYANVEIGDQIPPELYEAVANVLAYVYKLQGKN